MNISYRLIGATIKTEYSVTNDEKDYYENYYLVFEQETCTIPKSFPEAGLLALLDRNVFMEKTVLALDYCLLSHDAIILDELTSRSVSLLSKTHDKAIQLAFADFLYLIVWSIKNKSPFIALEPWSGLST